MSGPTPTRDQVLAALAPLVGLPLSGSHRAVDLRVFKFGRLRPFARGGEVGDYALHVQCAWRLDAADRIITGRRDLIEPLWPGPDFDFDDWDYDSPPNLQDVRMAEVLLAHARRPPVVAAVDADAYGGATLAFDSGVSLRLFPVGTRGEDWRIFRPCSSERHFVIAGGRVEPTG